MENCIKRFYEAFQRLDAEDMAACYHKDVVFEDPAFGVLKGERAENMWRMLCDSQKGKDFRIKFDIVKKDELSGTVHWEAKYTFSKTGRSVHNIIRADFIIKDGLIIRHTDHFDLYRWSKQAMGLTGFLLGWTSYFQNKLQAQTNSLLDKYEKQRNNQ